MSISLTRCLLLCIVCFLLGMWFQANQAEGISALQSVKNSIGKMVRGEGSCPKDYICVKQEYAPQSKEQVTEVSPTHANHDLSR